MGLNELRKSFFRILAKTGSCRRQDLAEDPTLITAIEMRGSPGVRRARFHHDRYRMIYQISRGRKHILVTRIRPRPTAYEGMKGKA